MSVPTPGNGLRSGQTSPSRRESMAEAKDSKYGQQREKSNLDVTKEMRMAYTRCETKVNHIIKDCRDRNRKFRDMDFDLEEDRDICLYGLEKDIECQPPDVLRVTDIFTEPIMLFKEGATADDLVQGKLQDCWFLAALATVCTASKDANWIEKEICVKHDKQVGVYGFIFYRDGGWTDVVIDDLLFVHAPKYETLTEEEQRHFRKDKNQYNEVARSGSKSLYFASSGTEGETWVPLIEKAFAKIHGDYAALNYGFTCDAVESLTGGAYNCFHLHDVLNHDKFWEQELQKMKSSRISNTDAVFSCMLVNPSPEENSSEIKPRGLMPEHAYSIIEVIEHEDTGKRFVKIRNPWGSGGEWDGPWSDGSKEWTSQWDTQDGTRKVRIHPEDLRHEFGDDGQFIMEYKDFMATWSYVDRTKLFNKDWVYSSHWLNVSTRPTPCAWSPGDVSFSFTVAGDTPAIIILSQLDDRAFQELSGCYQWSLDFVVYKQGPGAEEIGRSTHERLWRRSVNLELKDLKTGTYIVHVRIDRKHKKDMYMELYHRHSLPKAGNSNAIAEGSYHSELVQVKDRPLSLSRPYLRMVSQRRQEWDERKLEKKWAAAIASKRLASNFVASRYEEMIPITHDFLGGRDLHEIQSKALHDSGKQVISEAGSADSNGSGGNGATAGLSSSHEANEDNERSDGPSFPGFICSQCQNSIKGPFWRCQECITFDICSQCYHRDNKGHGGNSPHLLLPIRTVEEARRLMQDAYSKIHPEDHELTIGLRVYTRQTVESEISGSLRQGKILRYAFNRSFEESNDQRETATAKRKREHEEGWVDTFEPPPKRGNKGSI